MNWGTALAFAFGALCVFQAFRVRAGKDKTFYVLYRTGAPPWVRNRAFALLPVGIALMAGAGVAAQRGSGTGGLFILLVVTTWVGLILSIAWIFRPPGFMKPLWLRDLESGRSTEDAPSVVLGAPGPGGSRRVYLPPAVFGGLWVATALVFASWILFDWPPSVLVGLGAAISTLAVMTPRK
jgi:hypothetical protein